MEKENEIEYIEITSVNEYLEQVNKYRDDSPSLFFRGQKNQTWKIAPGVFRNGYLEKENELIEESIRQCYHEFPENMSNFDKLTKLQHYGQATRLIDVTTNSLVALYFATEIDNETEYRVKQLQDKIVLLEKEVKELEDEKNKVIEQNNEQDSEQDNGQDIDLESNQIESSGVVFVTKNEINKLDSLQVRIAMVLPFIEIGKEISTISDLFELIIERVQLNKQEKDYITKDNFINLINILQNNYFVIAPHSNSRLTFQSGGFIIPTCINIEKVDKEYKIWKAQQTFESEFDNIAFVIRREYKENIRKELDRMNINESALFPELEHKLLHVFKTNKPINKDKVIFEKYSFKENEDENVADVNQIEKSNDTVTVGGTATIANPHDDYIVEFIKGYIEMYPNIDDVEFKRIIRSNILSTKGIKDFTGIFESKFKKELKRFLTGTVGYEQSVKITDEIVDRLKQDKKF